MKKDGKGNIIISESDLTEIINGNNDLRNQVVSTIEQKYIFTTSYDNYYLSKRYVNQTENTEWSGDDVGKVYELFKDTVIEYDIREDLLPLDGSEQIKDGSKPLGKTEDGWIAVEPEPRPWLIERPLRYDYEYLTISENGCTNRPWTEEEVTQIEKLFNKNGKN